MAARRSVRCSLPFAGVIADRFGQTATDNCCCGGIWGCHDWNELADFGSCLLVIARGALGTLFAAAVAKIYQDSKIKALARNQTWRDIGAAAGPLVAGTALTIISPEMLHFGVAMAFGLAFIWFLKSPGWHILSSEHQTG